MMDCAAVSENSAGVSQNSEDHGEFGNSENGDDDYQQTSCNGIGESFQTDCLHDSTSQPLLVSSPGPLRGEGRA